MDARQAILDEIRLIERSKDVQVLYAVESGSRAWGFSSPDSDFDVRFVYVRPISEYLRLEDVRDVIEYVIDGKNFAAGVDFDAVGWDLGKFLRLLRNSNPSAIEWLSSNDPYIEDSRFWEVKKLLEKCFSPRSVALHYYGMAKKHDLRYLKADLVVAKKYLYVVRAILAAEWALKRLRPAPLAFSELVDGMLPAKLRPEVEKLLEIKLGSDERRLVGHSRELDEWILSHLEAIPEEASLLRRKSQPDWAILDSVYRKLLGLTP